MSYRITTDSTADLPQEFLNERGIAYVGLAFQIGGEEYREGPDLKMTSKEFYDQLRAGTPASTVQVNTYEFIDFAEPFLAAGEDVLHIAFSSGLSGTYESCARGAEELRAKYPDRKIVVVDSTFDTVLQGLFVLEACRLRDLGLEYEQITEALLSIRESGRIFFTIGSIDYLKHGGRIGKLAGIAASALKIKPLITLKEGEIFNSGITRSRQKSMQKVVEMTEKYLDEVQAKPGEYSFCIGYGYDYEEAVGFREMLKDLIRERLGIEEIGLYQIGATIGVHTGPYPIGIGIVRHAEV